MPTIQNTSRGQVVQIWGKAYIRGTDGVWRPLALGEVVPQGSEILTEQNAIVMMARDEKPLPVIAQAPALPASVDRAIAALDSGDAQDAPAAGLAGGGGGDLQPGLRIDRIVELVTPATIVSGLGTDAVQFGLATRSDPAASPDAPRLIAASSSIAAVEAGGSVNLGLLPPSGAGATGTALTVNVSAVPTIGQVFTAAGAVVVAGSVLDVADLAGLTYIPPADYAAGTPVGPFSYTVSNGIESADGATQIAVTPVNDAPLATGASLAGTEDILIDIGLQASDVDGTVVRFVVGTLPANGTLLLADTLSAVAVGQSLTPAQAATLVFRPAVNWNGSTSFNFSAVDNEGAVSAPATITLTVSAVNDPPVAVADSASTVAQAPVTVAVLGNDSDTDTDPLAVVSASVAAAFGSVVVNGDGTLTFTAAPGVTGPVAIGYTIADPSGATSTATLTVNVAAMPTVSVDVPALTNDSTPTLVGSSNLPAGSTVTLTVTDAGGAVQTFSTTVRPDGSYGVDVPAALAEGPYTAVASVNGPGGSSASANDSGVVDITPPVITVDAPALTSDSTPPLTGSTDLPAGSTVALTVTGANGVSQLFATTVQAGGSFAIDVPAALVNGTFTVVAQATDAAGNSASASDNGVVDTVAPVITVDAPALTSDSTPPLTGSTDLPAGSTVTLTVTGANGAVQTFSGTVQADGSYAVSVPAALVEGNFSVVASGTDAAGNSASATDSGVVDTTAPTLTVDAPALTNDTTPPLTGTTDLPPGATVSLAVTGANGAIQTFSATVQAGGTFSVDVPAALVQGPFSVSATATDAAGNSAIASDNGVIDTTPPAASITIDPVTADNIVNAGEATGTITITGTVGGDVQVGDTVTLNVNGAIFSGLVGAGDTFAIDVPGSAVLADADRRIDGSVTTTDAAGNSTTATAQRPYAVNTAPIAVDDALSVGEDAVSAGGDVTPGTAAQDRDADGDTLTVIGVATGVQPSASGNVNAPLAGTWGTLLLDGLGAYTYAPSAAAQALDPGQTVTDTFTYTISDGRGGSATATLSVSVVGADDPTTISGVFVGSVTEDAVASAGGVLAASDADVGTRAFVVQTNSAGTYGTFSIDNAGTWSYALSNAAANVQALAPGQSVTETFVVAADDGTTASITVTVNGTNDAPVVSSTSITAVEEGSPIDLGVAAPSDVDNGSVLAITVTGLPTIGQVRLADGTPVANGATLSAAQLTGLRYLPPADYAGAPVGAFAYTVSDGLATVAGGTTITVSAVNDRPVAIDASASGFEDSATRIAVSPAGSDVDGTVTSFTLTSVPANGALYAADTGGAPLAAGAVVTGPVYFQPNANFNGTASFNYTATDNSGAVSANTATATIVVNPVADTPTGADATVTIAEDGSRTFGSADFGFTDTDVGDTLAAVRIESLPAVGTLTLGGVAVGAGQVIAASQLATLVYTPVADASGSPYASFTFSVQDNGGLFDTAPNTITLNVTPVNDPPLAVVTPASGDEDTPIAVSLTGTDIDGTVTTVTVTALPANGVLFLADGVTPVAVNTPLSAAAAASLVFRPAADFNGTANLTFTVTDNDGAVSAPAVLPITVAPVVDPAISIDDVTVNEAAGTVTFTVTLDQPTTAPVAVNFATSAGSATDGADYTGSSGTLTFSPGVTTQTITLAIADDGTYEGAETFNVVLTGAVNATIADGTGVATIRDDGTGAGGSDDDRPTIAVSSPAVGEGGAAVFTVALSNPSTGAVTFTPSLSSGSATVGTDTSTALEYFNGTAWLAVPVDGVTIAAGSTSVQVRVATSDDFAAEGDETFDLTATVTAGTTANASASGTATIGDDSDAVSLTLSASPVVAEGGAIVYTATLTQAALTPLNLTLSNGTVITIAAGATIGSVSVAAPSNDVYVDAGSVSATIAGTVGGGFESLVISPAAATTVVTDTIDTTTVSITGDAVVAEGATAGYTVSLTSPAQTAVTVNLAYSGTAADGSDFTGIATVTIPAGASSAGLNIATLQDVLGEGSESFTVTIISASGGNFEALAISGTNGSQATQIVDDDTPSLAVSSPTVGEGGFAVFTVSLSNPSTGAVTFNPVLSSGTATVGTDTGAALEYFNGTAWVAVPVGGVTLAAGETSVQIRVATTDDFAAEGSEQFSLTANVTAGLTANASATGTATITDDVDATTVSLSATPSVAEGGSITYTATLNHAAVTAMTVTLSTGQTITIAAGATSGSVSIGAPGDDPYVDAGSVSRNIASTSGGGLEAVTIDGTAAVTTVTDTIDVTTATLTATPSVAEGGTITYTVSLNAPVTGSDVSVLLANGQTVTIPVGSSNASVSAIAPDNVYGGGASVANAIVSASGGNFEQLTSDTTPVTTTVTDDGDVTTVTLSATPSVVEGGSIVYTATLTSAAQTPVTVTLSNGAVITIGAGATVGTVSVAAPGDDPYVDASTVSTTISTATGGNFENLQVDASPATTSVTDDVDVTTVTLSATPSVAEGGSIVYTATLTHAAQTAVTVTLSTGQVITIAAGATSGSVSIGAPGDDPYIDAGSVSRTIASASGGNFESLVVDPAAATTTVTDTIDTTTVSITGDASVAEGATASYTVSLTSPAQTAVTVNLAYSGTAADGSDFTGVATVTIPAGASSANFSLATLQDVLAEGAESFSVTVASAAGGNFEALAISATNGSQTTSITDDDTPTISVSSPTVAEGGLAVFTVSLSNPSTSAITFTPALASGTATVGTDTSTALEFFNGSAWVAVPGSGITLAPGSTSVQVRVATTDDVAAEGSEAFTLTATVTAGLTANASATGSATITDDVDATTLVLGATPSVAEGGTIVYTATLSNAAVSPLTVTLSTGQTITIAAGATSGTVSIAAPGDDPYIDAGSVSRTIATTTGGGFESLSISPAAAVTTVTDTLDVTSATLTATPSVAEGGTITYTVSLGAPVTGSAVVVTLSGGQTVTIPVGASSGIATSTAPDNAYAGGGSVSNAITAVSGGNFEQLTPNTAPVTTTVTDDADVTTLSLSATASVVEGGSITYTATLSNAAQTPVTVTLSTGQTITIAAGATSGTVSIAAPGDDPYIDAGTVSRTIATATGGGFEQLTINPAAAVTNVTDDSDATTVSLTATPSVVEGGTITYTATLSNAAQTAVTVTLSTGQTITIAAGANSGTVSILAPTDDPYLDAGIVSRTITSAAGGNFELLTVDPTAAVTTVTDDSDVTTVSLSATPSVAEGGTIVYTATLTNAAQTPVTVTLSTGQVITIAAGATTGTVSIAAPGDDPYIDAGSVSRTIASASGGNFESLAVNPAAAVTTVTDTIDVTAATLTATPNVTEGGTITYTVSLGAPVTGSPVVVALSGGQTITIPVGASSGTATAATPDNVYAGGGSVSNAIATISGGNFEQLTPNTTPVTTTVSDDADVTTVSLAATPSVVEGGNITYTATLTNAAQSAVTVTLSSGQAITIAAGATTGTVAIAAPGDDPYVDAGTVSRTIATATGGGFESLAINPAAASTTVTDDSDATTVTLSATPSVAEGGSIVYTATLTNAAQTPVTVTLSTGQTITIAAGATSGTVSIAAPGDDVVVDATTVSRTITTATGGNFEALTINPAAANTSVTDTIDTTTLSITGSTSVAEGASGSYTVSLTSPAQTAVTVTLAYSGTALNGADFTGVATVTIPAGASSANFSIATLDDLIDEVAAESFTVAIGATSGGNFENLVVSASNGSVTTTIVDNDAAPTVTVSSPTVAEGGGFAQFTVSLSNPSSTATTFSLALANGTATGSGTDYGSGTPTDLQVSTDGGATWANATTATIAANATSVLVRTPIVNDALDETDETFTLTATRTAGTTANASASGTATITDDDATPSLSIGNVSVNESAGTMTFTVTLSAASGLPVSVGYATSNGTATAGVGADYTASSGTLTFAAGVTSQTVTVTIAEDALTEVSETLNVTLSGATNATIATATGVGTIVDNDTPPQGRDATLTTLEDTAIVFGLSNFLMNDAEQGNNVSPSAVRIDTVPSNGNLFLNGVLVTAGQVVSAAAIGAGQLSFVPASNANGAAYASIGFSVRDASGQYDTAPNTITVNVTPVSDGAPDARNDLFQTTFGTPITLTAAQLLANDTLPDGATITAVGGASGGSLVNNGNGTYTWTPSGAGTGSFTYTLTDQDGQTDTATVRIVANAAADDLATVNESALASGTGAGSVTASGNLFANDTGNTSISTVTFNGTTVSDGGAGDVDARTGYIGVASAVGRLVVDSAGAGAGDYTYTLLRNANNSAATDDTSITESFSYNANNTDAALRVTITDDAPAAVSRTVQVSEDQVPSYRLVLVLDVSGSMDTTSAGGAVRQINADGSTTITTRLDLARQALAQLVEEYYNQAQNVSITLITFSGSATIVNPGTPYTSKEDAVNAILTADGSGGTNYSSALTAAQTAFGTVDPSVRNAVYFLSDGAPSGGDLVNPAASTGYATFVNSNGISSYAVGVGTGIATTGPLNGIHNVDADGNGSSDGAIIVPDLNDLGSALLSTVPLAYGGNVVSSSADGNVLGADGGYIQTVTVKLDTDGNAGTAPVDVTFTHNPATNQISSSIAGFPAGFPISGDLLTLGASRGFGLGTLTFNFSTGDYTYFTGGTASEGDSFGFSFVARDGDGDVTPPSTLTVQIADGQPVARPDSDTLLANQTRMEGNVITGLGTDAGLALGGQLTNFAPSGAGVDDAIDGAQISSVSFKGVSYDLGAAASGSGAGFTWSVSAAGQLTWTATSGGEQLVFARTGFYQYAPPATALPTVLTNAAQTTLFNTAANADDNGVVLSAITRTGGTTTLGHNNPGGSADDGVGVAGGDSSGTVDNLETLVVAFSQATHPRGVQGVSFVVSANQSNLGDDGAGTIRSLTYTVYDVAGNELGQFYSTGEGTVAMPAQYSNIGRIEIEANSAADARISSVTFSSINIDTAAAAAAPVEVGYTLTDSDGDSSSSTLTLRVMGNSLFGDSAGNGITGTAGNDRIDGAEGNDTLDGAAGNDLLLGGDGVDAVSGGDGIDELRGGAGNDALNGGNGNDVLVGGMGHDALTGAAGADVFRWELADRGAAGTPALDTVADFSAAQGDKLDLRDLLQGETLDGGAIGNLGNYLFVERTGANTTIHISSNGGFTSGYNAGAEDQTIVLSGVDLTAASTLTSQQVIAELLNNNRLTVDP